VNNTRRSALLLKRREARVKWIDYRNISSLPNTFPADQKFENKFLSFFYRLRIFPNLFSANPVRWKCAGVGDRSEGRLRSNHDCDLNLIPSPHMSEDPETYLAVLKAAYDYEPQPDAEDEISIKEDQVLLLVERVDDELSIQLSTTPQFPSDFQSFFTVGGGSSRNKTTTRLPAWFPLRMSSKYGPGPPWHSVHNHLSFRPTARAYIGRQRTLRL